MADITLFGETRCAKTQFYQRALEERGLEERGLEYELAEVDKQEEAAKRLTSLTGSPTKFPTFEIKGRKVRNPKLGELDKELARAELYDPGLVHDEKNQRFIRHMAPSDAFVSYIWQGETMILTHIEVDRILRGTGRGARLTTEVFETLENRKHPLQLTCPFLRRVAKTRPKWSDQFNIGE